ncbi:MAG TPA: IPT/TIG domain-containing protein [Steroidobacteraceae bacterium]|nr:IPT/TIG domain-containing protein [Steroidobacteraceae bacterium]
MGDDQRHRRDDVLHPWLVHQHWHCLDQADPVTLTGISPSAVLAGGAGFTLTLTGTNFSKNSIVIFNQSPQPTTFVSSTQLTATIDAATLVTPEQGSVTVESSSQEYAQVSAAVPLFVLAPGPDPTVTSLTPSSVIVGSPGFTLTVNGANYTIWFGGALGRHAARDEFGVTESTHSVGQRIANCEDRYDPRVGSSVFEPQCADL